MAGFVQENRRLSVTTPLGPDALLMLGFTGVESVSQLFRFQLDLISDQAAIAPADLVGKPVGWSVASVHSEPRYFHGIVSRMTAGGRSGRGMRTYRLEVVPWLWLLTRTTDCRIFQAQTTPEIVQTVFDDLGFADYDLGGLQGSFVKWDYCVQYRESAFQFVSRLLEHEGIFYYFRHEESKHTLVIANAATSFQDVPESPVRYLEGSLAANHVGRWERQYEFRSGKWTRTDYNFETPSTSLQTSTTSVLPIEGLDKFEVFDFPGAYGLKGDGEPLTKIRMEAEEAGFDVVSGASQCCTFTAGGSFTLEEHEIESENGAYVLTSVRHSAVESSLGGGGSGSDYSNSFTCIPDSVPYRPERATPKPVVQGLQTAVVVGPSGEEIYVDKYGRVKVQFFWDRKGVKDEKSSCWVRVAEQWAGKNWGLVAHPRIGQEVVVEFLEGDPDRPLITGRVYNAEQMPPYDLPASMTQSGIKSRSSKGGGPANFNEIRFEDKKGSEQLFIHAEKNQDIEVENDETHWVGHDRKKTIDHDETTLVKHDRTETVDNDETITIKHDRTETVENDETITIKGNRTETVEKDETITINGNRTETVEKDETITINGNRTETVEKDETITINGNRTETVEKDETISINGNRTESVAKDETVSIDGNRTVTVSKDDTLTITKNLVIDAGESITIQTGSASIVMQKDGTIQISGKDITIKGSGKINVKASGDMVLKGSKIGAN